MDSAKLFCNGRSQAVRLPRDYRFDGEELYIEKIGNAVVLIPKCMRVVTDAIVTSERTR